MRRGERLLSQIPRPLIAGFVFLFCLQIFDHQLSTRQVRLDYRALSTPFTANIYSGISMGSAQLMSYLLAIRLQLHDNQLGKHIRYDHIDYVRLVNWLDQIYQLNRRSEYTMMLASRVYSQTQDKKRLKIILDYVENTFLQNPQLHWRRLAESTVIAKHQLGDLKLALQMAEKLANQPDSVIMPRWARDIRFLLLADLNEYESALSIISGLLNSGEISDRDEKRFLQEKLLLFQQKLSETQQ